MKEERKTTTLYLAKSMLERIQSQAAREDSSANGLMVRVLSEYLNRHAPVSGVPTLCPTCGVAHWSGTAHVPARVPHG